MRVVQGVLPQERKTLVELNDREITMINRALFEDSTNEDENADLSGEFNDLCNDLNIPNR